MHYQIIATHFFLVLRFDNLKTLFLSNIDYASVVTVLTSIGKPLIFLATIVSATFALIYLFRAIITQSYRTIDLGNTSGMGRKEGQVIMFDDLTFLHLSCLFI